MRSRLSLERVVHSHLRVLMVMAGSRVEASVRLVLSIRVPEPHLDEASFDVFALTSPDWQQVNPHVRRMQLEGDVSSQWSKSLLESVINAPNLEIILPTTGTLPATLLTL